MQNLFSVPCGCCSFTQGMKPCFCASFPSDWRSPKEHWRGSLMDWMNGDVVQRIWLTGSFQDVTQQEFEVEWLSHDQSIGEAAERRSMGEGSCEQWTFIRSRLAPLAPDVKRRIAVEWDIVSCLSSIGSWRIIDVN